MTRSIMGNGHEGDPATYALTVRTIDRLLGAVAHQVGAAMLPTLRDEPELAYHRAWKRLSFVAEAMASHIRGHKRALDELRGSLPDDAVSLPAVEWVTWIPQLLEGLVPRGQVTATFELNGRVPPALGRTLTLVWAWINVAAPSQEPVNVRVSGGVGEIAVLISGLPLGSAAASAQYAAEWSECWSSVGELQLETADTTVRLKLKPSQQ